uniref:Uncharacterized protein n=1 Tax=Hemipteran chu-related virus OKIAV140 TaxID=2792592 RepID=A0A7T0Q4J1_9VIRU|nr:hypothetical protein [Hemipteran chu-related virus OKIAV140]
MASSSSSFKNIKIIYVPDNEDLMLPKRLPRRSSSENYLGTSLSKALFREESDPESSEEDEEETSQTPPPVTAYMIHPVTPPKQSKLNISTDEHPVYQITE